jgi:RimJ/RimL family protein N-acetyltransferase
VIVELREVREEDLAFAFALHRDPVARAMAVFVAEETYEQHVARWRATLVHPERTLRMVVVEGMSVGYVASFLRDGVREVSYWIERSVWGRGVATAALAKLLELVAERPVHARVALGNGASRRVLEKNGFELVQRGDDELLLVLRNRGPANDVFPS